MTISRKLSTIASVVLIAGLTLSACGGKDDSAGDKTGGTQAPAKADSLALTQANFTQVLSDSQVKAKSAHIDMEIGAAGQTIQARGDVSVGATPAETAMTMTMDMGSSMSFEMRLVDQIMYMNLGQMSDDKFLKMDLTDENNPITKQYGQMLDQMDPAKQMADLKGAVTSFEKKGDPQTIDGVKAQPYVVEVDTSKVPSFKDLPDASADLIPESIVYTMYIGSDNLLRRMSFDLAGSKSTMNYSKWGEPVNIEAPSADQISDDDISKLMGGAPA